MGEMLQQLDSANSAMCVRVAGVWLVHGQTDCVAANCKNSLHVNVRSSCFIVLKLLSISVLMVAAAHCSETVL